MSTSPGRYIKCLGGWSRDARPSQVFFQAVEAAPSSTHTHINCELFLLLRLNFCVRKSSINMGI